MTRRARWGTGLAIGAVVFAASCYNWSAWDNVFDPNVTPTGWTTGDGAISVPLPPCVPTPGYPCINNLPRSLWMFGDSPLNWFTGSGPAYMVNNTIAVQERQDGEPPQELWGEMKFWARRWNSSTGTFVPQDVTFSVPSFPVTNVFNMTGFMLNGDETNPSLNKPLTTTIWGASGVYLADGTADGKVVLFYEPTRCHGPANTAADYIACRQTFDPLPEFLGERLLVIDNPSTSPDHWTATTVDLGAVDRFSAGNIPRVRWGTAVLAEGLYVYIYGKPSENDVATHDVDEQAQVKLALATPATIGNYAQWWFIVNDGNGSWTFQQGAPAKVSDLYTIATTAANIWSVNEITYNGKTRWVTVEPIAASTHGVMRISDTPFSFPDYALPARDPAMGQDSRPLSRTDRKGKPVTAGMNVIVANVQTVEPNLDGFARDFRAHPELRGTSTVSSSELLISYHADHFKDGAAGPGGIEGKLRFTKWSLDSTYPWCAKGADANGDEVGDDLSACVSCGNGKLDPNEDCDPTAPAGSSFDMSRGQDANGNGIIDCSDASKNFYMMALLSDKNVSASTTKSVGCTSFCTLDKNPCLPDHRCNLDSDCSLGQACECYPTADNCQCTRRGWTPWTDRDTPNGAGDYERVADYAAAGLTCPRPTNVACRRRSDGKDAKLTGETIVCDTDYGFKCVNANQSDGACDDYEVSFYCAPTRWFNRDKPTTGNGDFETLSVLRSTGDACDHPTDVECRRHNADDWPLALVDSSANGESVRCDTSYGFSCVKANQSDGKCDDYEIRFYCGQ